jgi:hypothetical protein
VTGTSEPRGLSIVSWKPIAKNTLRGFACVRIGRLGLVVADVAVHQKNQSRWVSLPARAMIDRDGGLLRDDAGKIKYASILQWSDRKTADRFGAAVVEALLARFPDALAGEPL